MKKNSLEVIYLSKQMYICRITCHTTDSLLFTLIFFFFNFSIYRTRTINIRRMSNKNGYTNRYQELSQFFPSVTWEARLANVKQNSKLLL